MVSAVEQYVIVHIVLIFLSEPAVTVEVARGRKTSQSSTHGPAVSSRAVDGITGGRYFLDGSCTHTLQETNPWWRVDLGSRQFVTELIIYNRQDCCDERLRNFEIRIGDSLANNGNNNPLCGRGLSLDGKRRGAFYCAPPLVGRYVNIRRVRKRGILTLCEVEVYAISSGAEEKCPDYRWHHFRGSCYFYQHSTYGINWNTAISKCREKQSHLADIRDEEEWRFVTDNAPRDMGQFRIGITDDGHEGVWTFQDGTRASFLKWSPGEPNGGKRENCLTFFTTPRKRGLYNDGPCWYRYSAYVCKRDAIRAVCETHWRSFGGSIYQVCDIATNSWIDAQKACQDVGANLIVIETQAEKDFLSNVVKTLNIKHTWLGLIRGFGNQFYWIDGTIATYTNWLPNEPNHFRGNEYCADLRDGNWNDVPCKWAFNGPRYICEKKNCSKSPLVNTYTAIRSSSNMDAKHNYTSEIIVHPKRTWCPQSNSSNEWLEVDLGAPYLVCGISAINNYTVNGSANSVTWYGVAMSLTPITEGRNNFSQEFRTDSNTNRSAIQELHGVARYIRFTPTRWIGWPCLKVQIYGDGKVPQLKMVISLKNKTEEHVSTVSFKCLALGFPFPRYTWAKDGSSLIPNGELLERNTVLQLTEVNITNQGWYECKATNLLGSVSSSAYLTVHAKPKDLKFHSPIAAKKGDNAVLSCESFSFPLANVTWSKEGQITSDERFSVSNTLVPGTNRLVSNLTIFKVSENDIGSYKCLFWNYRGSVEGRVELRIAEDCRLVTFDFEDGKRSLNKWRKTGNAFNNQPTYGDNVKVRFPSQTANNQGSYWIGTYENRPSPSSIAGARIGSSPQGTLISPEFQITGPTVSFLVGGGCSRAAAAVQLLLGGYPVLAATGNCKSTMRKVTWDLKQHIGKTARLRLIDFSSLDYISFDDFRGDISICRGCTEPLGLTNGQIPDFAITASSKWDRNHAPKYGRLYTLDRDGHSGAWKSGRHVLGEWFQVDLGASVTITKIATQGRNWRNRYVREWVKSYTLAYSRDGESFEYYKETLKGNNDRNTIVENRLSTPIRGRYIRVYPKTWRSRISMRVELYGCPPTQALPKIQNFGLIPETARTVGSTISLYCEATGFPYIKYSWTNLEGTVIPVGQRLLIPKLSESDDGLYTCTATNKVGMDTFNVRLHVYSAPSIVEYLPKKQVLRKNTVSELRCRARCKPTPIVTWFKNDVPIARKTDLTIFGRNIFLTKLQITNIDFEDGGVYKCVFNNSEGMNSSRGIVVIHAAPEFTLKPENTTVTEGDDIKLICAASAVPVPSIRWKLNGKYLHTAEIIDNGTLVIQNAKNSEVSEGVYTCEASNEIGQKSAMAWLTVYSRPAFMHAVPDKVNTAKTQTAILHCDVIGDPEPELEWSKDGTVLQETNRIAFQRKKRTLVIRVLVEEDSAEYQCTARNAAGHVTATTKMSVFGKPLINEDLSSKEVLVRRGLPANLVCMATNPLPVYYKWTKDGETLSNSDNINVHNNILVVKPLQPKDFGVYVCHVSNYAGNTSYEIKLMLLSSSGASASALSSSREKVSIELAIILPFVIVLIVLVAVVILQTFRYRRLSKSCHATTSIGLETLNSTGGEPLLVNEQPKPTT